MIYIVNYGADRRKYVTPILSAEDFNQLRNSDENIRNLTLARQGDKKAKMHLVQFCYNSLHPTQELAGESYLNEFFAFDYDDPATREDFINKVYADREALGLLMLERSVSKGAHAIFLRHKGESIEEGLQRISSLTGFPYDKNCKDLNRVIFGTSSSAEDLLFLDNRLFSSYINMEEAKRETEELAKRPADITSQNATPSASELKSEPTTLTEAQHEIIKGAFRLCDYEPDEITEGMRENAIYSVAMKLRHWAGFKEEKLFPLLYPHYSYGLEEWEVRKAIKDALKAERGYMPNALKALIKKFEGNTDPSEAAVAELLDPIAQAYRPFHEALADEVVMPSMPKLMKTLLKSAPYGYKYPIMAAICPAACTLLTDVRMKYGTKKKKRMNSWTHLDGMFASNKGLMVQPIQTLLYELKKQDEANAKIMNEVKERNRLNHNKETLEKVPELPVRIVEAGTTRKQHIILMKNAKERHTFTMCEELDSLKSRKSGYYDRSDFERHLFDNGIVSVNTAVDDSPNISVKVMWNLATSSTRDQTIRHWPSATDGAVSRVWFVLMPDGTFAAKPKYYQFNDEEKAYISRASLEMMKLNGLLLTPKLDKALDSWDLQERLACEAAGNRVRAQLKNRAQEIAHTFGGVLHCMDIVQQIMDRQDAGFNSEEERIEWEKTAYDFNQYKENPQNIKMALFVVNKILDTQEALWGQQILDQTISACTKQKVVRTVNNDYTRLPSGDFTINDIMPLFPGRKKDSIRVMLSRYCSTSLLEKVGTCDRMTIYHKAS